MFRVLIQADASLTTLQLLTLLMKLKACKSFVAKDDIWRLLTLSIFSMFIIVGGAGMGGAGILNLGVVPVW